MSLDRLVEEKIREAMARGDFDDLPGKGKPLSHDAYFAWSEDMRLAFSVLKNAGYRPEELELLEEVGCLKQQLALDLPEAERVRLRRLINDKQLKLDLLLDQQRRQRRAMRKAGL